MTTKEIYNHLICKPDLHSQPELHDETLIWPLYKNAYIQAFCHDGDTSIDIINNAIFSGSMMHWHPDEDDMIDELYALGKKRKYVGAEKIITGNKYFLLRIIRKLPIYRKNTASFWQKEMGCWPTGLP